MKVNISRLMAFMLAANVIVIPLDLYAKDLGVVGQVYTILEDDFLQLVEARYQSMKNNGEWDRNIKAWQKQIIDNVERPSPVLGLTQTTVHRSYYVDPSIELAHNIYAADGQIIANAGTVVNPLDRMTFHKTLLFIDADNPKQIAWAIKQDRERDGKTKWILVNGSISDTVKSQQKPVYFDQGGKLISHFKIEHVPAMLYQNGKQIKIEECLP